MCSIEDENRPLEIIEREITELAAHIYAATCRWLSLVAEFDRREGWAQWGCTSCAHWVSWRCGITPAAAREHVRVARRLEELPAIRAAFAEGRLSYSKVRALTRVGTIEREKELLGLALHATASQLERIVRGYRGVVAAERAAAGGQPERYVTWSHADDGSLLLRARLPPEEGAVVLAALEAGVDRLAPRAPESTGPARVSAETPSTDFALAADGLAADHVPAEAPAADLDSVSAETPPPPIGERRADALVLMADTLLAAPAHAGRSGGDRYQVVVHADEATLRGEGPGERCELADGTPLAAETARRLACDASVVPLRTSARGQPLSVGRKTRSIPPALRRALNRRDHGCRFPGCTRARHLDAHHIEHWARGGHTSLGNLVHLCHHHHRLLHEGGYTVSGDPAGALLFRRPDGRAIPACPRGAAGRPGALPERHRGLAIGPETCVPAWARERYDFGLAVDALLTFAPPDPVGI
jgi:hypothetical protein